jgi:NitT/TauT family transport system substrate-binding protein
VALLIALLLALPACGAPSATPPGQASTKVVVAVPPMVDVAPIYLGRQQGFFAAEKIDLTLKSLPGEILPEVADGRFQFGFSDLTSLLLAQAKGRALKIVTAGDGSTGTVGADMAAVAVRRGSPITRPAQLAGRKVAVDRLGGLATTTIAELVRRDGGNPKKITFVRLDRAQLPGALSRKQVDAAAMTEPYLTLARRQGATPLAWNLAVLDPKLMTAAYVTAGRLKASNPDLVQRFATAMNTSLDYAQQHPGEVRAVLSGYLKLDPTVASALTLPAFSTAISEESLTRLGALAVQDGLLTRPPDVTALMPRG